MSTRKIILFLLAGAAVALLAGCSTPQTRIARHRALYDRLPAEQQVLIQEGRVAIGFTPDMVRLALGDPDRIYVRTDRRGSTERWIYTAYGLAAGRWVYRGYYHGWHPARYPFYTDFPDRIVYDRFRVVFTEGRVSAIEELTEP